MDTQHLLERGETTNKKSKKGLYITAALVFVALVGCLSFVVAYNTSDISPNGDGRPNTCSLSSPLTITGMSSLTRYPDCMRFNLSAYGNCWTYNTEDEPALAVNPLDSDNQIVVHHQDDDGDVFVANLIRVTKDGGRSWYTVDSPITGKCQAATIPGSENDYDSASDPYVVFDYSGVAHFISTSFNVYNNYDEGSVVFSSYDGGDTWTAGYAVTRDNGFNNYQDRDTIFSDPYRPKNAYAVWTDWQSLYLRNPTVGNRINIAITTDSGLHWTPKTYDTPITAIQYPADGSGFGQGAWKTALFSLPDAQNTLLLLAKTVAGASGAAPANITSVRSVDGGYTWSAPYTSPVQLLTSLTSLSPMTQENITVDGIPLALYADFNQQNGYIYVVADDIRYNPRLGPGVVIMYSADYGITWSNPVPVNPTTTGVDTFNGMVAVASDGTVGAFFYDTRYDVYGDNKTTTDAWLALFDPTLQNRLAEFRLTNTSFDYRLGAPSRGGYFIGHYQSFVSAGNDFMAVFTTTNAGVQPWSCANQSSSSHGPPGQVYQVDSAVNRYDLQYVRMRRNPNAPRCTLESNGNIVQVGGQSSVSLTPFYTQFNNVTRIAKAAFLLNAPNVPLPQKDN